MMENLHRHLGALIKPSLDPIFPSLLHLQHNEQSKNPVLDSKTTTIRPPNCSLARFPPSLNPYRAFRMPNI